jgi:plasmid maintenance system antidote protein VapI
MPPERTKELVDQLRTWYRAGTTRQMDLASALGLSRQSLAEILSGRNGLTGEQAIAINSFLSDKHMNTKADYRAHLERINKKHEVHKDPLTLNEAWEQIDELHARLYPDAEPLKYEDYPKPLKAAQEMAAEMDAQLKSRSTAPKPSPSTNPLPVPPAIQSPPAPKPETQLPAARTATPLPTTAWEREVLRAHQAATADLSSEPLDKQSIPQLRSALNAEKDPTVCADIYRHLTERKDEIAALNRDSGRARQAQRNVEPKLTADQAPPSNPEKELPSWERVQSDPPPPAKLLPVSANTPFLIGEIIKKTNFEDLCSMLGNPEHTKLQRACLYAEVSARRAIVSDPK